VENVVGKVYGLLTVLTEAERKEEHRRRVLVRCSCEAATEKVVTLEHLRSGRTTSCGCVHKALLRARSTTHGSTKHPLYGTWKNMRQRCQNPRNSKYVNYGGRGITVCERWDSFENFILDMGPTYKRNLTLDRKDNSLGYSPENCRWATPVEQSMNRRNTLKVTLNGRTQALKDWCLELDLKYPTVYHRLKAGKTPAQALSR